MALAESSELLRKHCLPCEGGIPALAPEEVRCLLRKVPKWILSPDGKQIGREWRTRDFETALRFFDRVGELAEAEGHHPDLHLTSYRNVVIEISTHAVNGLTENDFILAAKIDAVPIDLKT